MRLKYLSLLFCCCALTFALSGCIPDSGSVFGEQDKALKKIEAQRLSQSFSDTLENDIAAYMLEAAQGNNWNPNPAADAVVKTIRCGNQGIISYVDSAQLSNKQRETIEGGAGVTVTKTLKQRFGRGNVGYVKGGVVVSPSNHSLDTVDWVGSGCADDVMSMANGSIESSVIAEGSPVIAMAFQDFERATVDDKSNLGPGVKSVATKVIVDCADTGQFTPPIGRVGVGKQIQTCVDVYKVVDGVVTGDLADADPDGSFCSESDMRTTATGRCQSTDIRDMPDGMDDVTINTSKEAGVDWAAYFASGGLDKTPFEVSCVGDDCGQLETVDPDDTGVDVTCYAPSTKYGFNLLQKNTDGSVDFPGSRNNIKGKNTDGDIDDLDQVYSTGSGNYLCNEFFTSGALGPSTGTTEDSNWYGDILFQYQVSECDIDYVDPTIPDESVYSFHSIAPVAMKCSTDQAHGVPHLESCPDPSTGELYVDKGYTQSKWVVIKPGSDKRYPHSDLSFAENAASLSGTSIASGLNSKIGSGNWVYADKDTYDANDYQPNDMIEYARLMASVNGTIGSDVVGCYEEGQQCGEAAVTIDRDDIIVVSDRSSSMWTGSKASRTYYSNYCTNSVKNLFKEESQSIACGAIASGNSNIKYFGSSWFKDVYDSDQTDDLADYIYDNSLDCNDILRDITGYCSNIDENLTLGGTDPDICQPTCIGECVTMSQSISNMRPVTQLDHVFHTAVAESLPIGSKIKYVEFNSTNDSDDIVVHSLPMTPDNTNDWAPQLREDKDKYQVEGDISYCTAPGKTPLLKAVKVALDESPLSGMVVIFSDGVDTGGAPTSGFQDLCNGPDSLYFYLAEIGKENVDVVLVRPAGSSVCSGKNLDHISGDKDVISYNSESDIDNQISSKILNSVFTATDATDICDDLAGQVGQSANGNFRITSGEISSSDLPEEASVCESGVDDVGSPHYPQILSPKLMCEGLMCEGGASCSTDSDCGAQGICSGGSCSCETVIADNNLAPSCPATSGTGCRDDDDCGDHGICQGYQPATTGTGSCSGSDPVCGSMTTENTCESICETAGGGVGFCTDDSEPRICLWSGSTSTPEVLGSCNCTARYRCEDSGGSTGSWSSAIGGSSPCSVNASACSSTQNYNTQVCCSDDPTGTCRAKRENYVCQANGTWTQSGSTNCTTQSNCSSGTSATGNSRCCATTPSNALCEGDLYDIYTCQTNSSFSGASPSGTTSTGGNPSCSSQSSMNDGDKCYVDHDASAPSNSKCKPYERFQCDDGDWAIAGGANSSTATCAPHQEHGTYCYAGMPGPPDSWCEDNTYTIFRCGSPDGWNPTVTPTDWGGACDSSNNSGAACTSEDGYVYLEGEEVCCSDGAPPDHRCEGYVGYDVYRCQSDSSFTSSPITTINSTTGYTSCADVQGTAGHATALDVNQTCYVNEGSGQPSSNKCQTYKSWYCEDGSFNSGDSSRSYGGTPACTDIGGVGPDTTCYELTQPNNSYCNDGYTLWQCQDDGDDGMNPEPGAWVDIGTCTSETGPICLTGGAFAFNYGDTLCCNPDPNGKGTTCQEDITSNKPTEWYCVNQGGTPTWDQGTEIAICASGTNDDECNNEEEPYATGAPSPVCCTHEPFTECQNIVD